MKERLKAFMLHKSLNAADLASCIGVQRSNISHVLSGRNYPGAQFLEKLMNAYPDLDARWLLTGEGVMIRDVPAEAAEEGGRVSVSSPLPGIGVSSGGPEPSSSAKPVKTDKMPAPSPAFRSGRAERIVILCADGTFREYLPG